MWTKLTEFWSSSVKKQDRSALMQCILDHATTMSRPEADLLQVFVQDPARYHNLFEAASSELTVNIAESVREWLSSWRIGSRSPVEFGGFFGALAVQCFIRRERSGYVEETMVGMLACTRAAMLYNSRDAFLITRRCLEMWYGEFGILAYDMLPSKLMLLMEMHRAMSSVVGHEDEVADLLKIVMSISAMPASVHFGCDIITVASTDRSLYVGT